MLNWKAVYKVAVDPPPVKPLWNTPSFNITPHFSKWAARPATGFHVFGKGDTLEKIADRYGVSYRRLAEANPKVNPTAIQLGAKINVPINEREWYKQTKNFDPEIVPPLPPNVAKAIRIYESGDGRWMVPRGAVSSAKGPYHMLKGQFEETQKRHPEMAGWKHDDLLKDWNKAHQAFTWTIQDNVRDYQYRYGKPMTLNYMIRSWHQPRGLDNELAANYETQVINKLREMVTQKKPVVKK